MNALVTACTESYAPLASLWLERMRRLTQLPIFVVCVGDWTYDFAGVTVIVADAPTNPFPVATPDHACAEKLRVFRYLPKEIDQILFVDIDIMVINGFWSDDLFASSRARLIIVPDHFVGYKEKMEDEFRPFDPTFKMKFLPTGEYFYFNTGVFFASRQAHESHFEKCLEVWRSYVRTLGRLPSVFDQNVFNYYLIELQKSNNTDVIVSSVDSVSNLLDLYQLLERIAADTRIAEAYQLSQEEINRAILEAKREFAIASAEHLAQLRSEFVALLESRHLLRLEDTRTVFAELSRLLNVVAN